MTTFPPPMPAGRDPLPHDRQAPAPRPGSTPPQPAEHLSPDCLVGKHRACSGTAWHFVEDRLVDCTCGCGH